MVHPSSIEAFEHHEGIRDDNSFVPLVTVQTLETGEPAPHEIKQLPPQPQHPHHLHHGSSSFVSSLPQRLSPTPAPHPGSFVPFVHNLHSPTSDIPKLIFSPLQNGPKPILVEIGRQVIPAPLDPNIPASPLNVVFTTPGPFIKTPNVHVNPTQPFLVHGGQVDAKTNSNLQEVPKSSSRLPEVARDTPSSQPVQTLQGSFELNVTFPSKNFVDNWWYWFSLLLINSAYYRIPLL